MVTLSLLSLLLLPCCAAVGVQKPLSSDQPLNDSVFDLATKDKIAEILDHYHIPGASIAVVDGNDIHSHSWGYAVLPDQKMTAGTLFFTASTEKSFTAATLLAYLEHTQNSTNPLSLKTKVSSILPDFKMSDDYATSHLAIEDIMSHRTGLPRHDLSYLQLKTKAELIHNLRFLPLTYEPRTKYQYNNIMFAIAAEIAATISGLKYEDAVAEKVLKPLGMNHTFPKAQDALDTSIPIATGYTYDGKHNKQISEPFAYQSVTSGAGDAISNVLDYGKYLRGMLQESFLSKQNHKDLRTARTITGSTPAGSVGVMAYTLGWETAVFRGHQTFFHGGAVPGHGTAMMYIPSLNKAYVIMGNSELGIYYANQEIQNLFFDRWIGPDETTEKDDPRERQAEAAEKKRADYVNARQIHFPNSANLSSPVSLASYVGIYTHPAYPARNLTLCESEIEGPFTKNGLCDERVKDLYPMSWFYEHVSGEHFLAWTHAYERYPDPVFDEFTATSTAEFRVNAAGDVTDLGILIEPAMGDEKIWFKKV